MTYAGTMARRKFVLATFSTLSESAISCAFARFANMIAFYFVRIGRSVLKLTVSGLYNEAPGLAEVRGEKFEELYERYEEGRGQKLIKVQKLWYVILLVEAQVKTGTPFMLYKDAVSMSHPFCMH